MRGKVLFIVSLIVIILSSWVNVDYFGSSRTNMFSPVVNQVVHIIALLLTGAIGYVNWRGKEKWVNSLWVALYIAVLAAFIISVIVFRFTGNELVKHVGVGLRNRFTEPLPFLVFFLLIQITRQLSGAGKTKG